MENKEIEKDLRDIKEMLVFICLKLGIPVVRGKPYVHIDDLKGLGDANEKDTQGF